MQEKKQAVRITPRRGRRGATLGRIPEIIRMLKVGPLQWREDQRREMEEIVRTPRGGVNHGKVAVPTTDGRGGDQEETRWEPDGTDDVIHRPTKGLPKKSLNSEEAARRNYGKEVAGGFVQQYPRNPHKPEDEIGLTHHRGTLHPDEYVDGNRLQELVDAYLPGGITVADVQAVLKRNGGPLPADRRGLRERVDRALAEIHADGGDFTALAAALEVHRDTLQAAARRGRVARGR